MHKKSNRYPFLRRLIGEINTLKAFANSGPGLRFGNPGRTHPFLEDATLKELRRRWFNAEPRNLFGVANNLPLHFEPRDQSKPWADIGQRFQRYAILAPTEFSTFCAKPKRRRLDPEGTAAIFVNELQR